MAYYLLSFAIIYTIIGVEFLLNWEHCNIDREPPTVKWVCCALWPFVYVYIAGLLLWDYRK